MNLHKSKNVKNLKCVKCKSEMFCFSASLCKFRKTCVLHTVSYYQYNILTLFVSIHLIAKVQIIINVKTFFPLTILQCVFRNVCVINLVFRIELLFFQFDGCNKSLQNVISNITL